MINPPFESVSNPPIDTPAGAPVLVVEDERDLAEEIRLELQASGHPVQLTETVDDGLRAARLGAAVLVIDRMLQGRMVFRLLRRCAPKATPRPPW